MLKKTSSDETAGSPVSPEKNTNSENSSSPMQTKSGFFGPLSAAGADTTHKIDSETIFNTLLSSTENKQRENILKLLKEDLFIQEFDRQVHQAISLASESKSKPKKHQLIALYNQLAGAAIDGKFPIGIIDKMESSITKLQDNLPSKPQSRST